jgi:hypothetical protein
MIMTYHETEDTLLDLTDYAIRRYLIRLGTGDFYDVLAGAQGAEVAVPIAGTLETLRRIRKDLVPVDPSSSVTAIYSATRKPILELIKEDMANDDIPG